MSYIDQKYLQDPHIQYPGHDTRLSFNDYITQCKKIITSNRLDLKNNAELIIDANAPFELRPHHIKGITKYGVLLIHGLFDSPFMVKDLGIYLQSQGYLARSVLLPGHGTVPGALLNVRYQDWIQTVNNGIASLTHEVDKIFIVGYSTGASLALHHAIHNPKIAGITLIAPALKIQSYIDFAANWHRIISWAWKRAKWLRVAPEIDYTKYQSIPFNSVYQVYLLAKQINKISKTRRLKCPMLLIASQDDEIISSLACMNYFKQYANENSHMIWYAAKNPQFNDPRMVWRNSAYPESHIQNFSHISLPIAPDNAHYGKYGDYRYASHPNDDKTQFIAQNGIQAILHHWLYRMNLTQYQYQRLSYNPDFNFLAETMSRFLG